MKETKGEEMNKDFMFSKWIQKGGKGSELDNAFFFKIINSIGFSIQSTILTGNLKIWYITDLKGNKADDISNPVLLSSDESENSLPDDIKDQAIEVLKAHIVTAFRPESEKQEAETTPEIEESFLDKEIIGTQVVVNEEWIGTLEELRTEDGHIEAKIEDSEGSMVWVNAEDVIVIDRGKYSLDRLLESK